MTTYYRWQFQIRQAITGLVLVNARRNGRGPWLHPRDVPTVRSYLCANERGLIEPEITLDLLRADKEILALRTPRGMAFKGILALLPAPGEREARKAAQRLKRWKARKVKGIYSLKDLAAHVGASYPTKESVARRLYKDTECGIGFSCSATGVSVSGYCEGTDAECGERALLFPFKPEEFDRMVEAADDDGCNLWDETHGCKDCGGDGEINPECETCKGQGVIL